MPQANATDDDPELQTGDDALDDDLGVGAGDPHADGDAGNDGDTTDELVVTIGDTAPEDEGDGEGRPAPAWLKELRKSNSEKDKRIRELEERDRQREKQLAPATIAVGAKPTLEGCNYDAEKFETELEGWHQRKREAQAQQDEAERAARASREDWDKRVRAYDDAKGKLKVRDFTAAEDVVKATFDVTQQGIVLSGADKPEILIYALGKNPTKAKELAAIKDPVKFSFAVAKLETQLKVAPRKSAPNPDRPLRGNAAAAGASVDNTLDRLRNEAMKTGDMTKVLEYKRQQRTKAA